VAVNKVLDILMHLQAHLRPDVGGAPALALSDFYAAMFSMSLEASHSASAEGFDEVIKCVRNVRDAWAIAAKDPEAGKVLSRDLRTPEEDFVPAAVNQGSEPEVAAARWSA
jgi:flagellar protein FliS